MHQDDGALIARVLKRNDQRAYASLVNRYQSKLRNSMRQLTGWDEALADDLAQETFIQAYIHLKSFKGEAQFFTWLYKIAYRQFAQYYRSRKITVPLEDNSEDEGQALSLSSTDLQQDIARALATFPPEQAMALHLHLHRGYTHQEVSEILETPLGTIKSHIVRGREKLKVLLSEWQNRVTTL